MTELPALEAALTDAARRRYPRRRRAAAPGRRGSAPRRARARRLTPVLVAFAVVAAAAGALLAVSRRDDPEREARPPEPAASGFERQLQLLGALRERTPADDDPQVRAQVRESREARPRSRYARLLGKAPSGGAFVLVPVRSYRGPDPLRSVSLRDGLCLTRRGSEGGAGVCGSTRDLLAGNIRGAIAGQVFGVVADGVTAVRPQPGAKLVPVRRNFYVYDDPRSPKLGPIPAPALCTRASCRPVAEPRVGVPGFDSRTPVNDEPQLPWGVRVDRDAAGLPCPAVGQIAAGELTRVVLGRRRAVPRATACIPPPVHTAVFKFESRVADHRQLLIVAGLASRDVREIRLTTAAGTRTLTPGPKGSFIAVYDDKPRAIERQIVFENGSTRDLPIVKETAIPADG